MKETEQYGEGGKQHAKHQIPHYLSNMVEAMLWHKYVWLPVE